jgi:hypothetical protein
MRKSLTTAALVAVATGTFVVGIACQAAAATPSAPDCRTATTTLKDRPDSGLNGPWANDTFTRTVQICRGEEVPAEVSTESTRRVLYTAKVTDSGTFTTVEGKSPVAGKPLKAGIAGKMSGGFTATFKAAPHFRNYQATLDRKTFTARKARPPAPG